MITRSLRNVYVLYIRGKKYTHYLYNTHLYIYVVHPVINTNSRSYSKYSSTNITYQVPFVSPKFVSEMSVLCPTISMQSSVSLLAHHQTPAIRKMRDIAVLPIDQDSTTAMYVRTNLLKWGQTPVETSESIPLVGCWILFSRAKVSIKAIQQTTWLCCPKPKLWTLLYIFVFARIPLVLPVRDMLRDKRRRSRSRSRERDEYGSGNGGFIGGMTPQAIANLPSFGIPINVSITEADWFPCFKCPCI